MVISHLRFFFPAMNYGYWLLISYGPWSASRFGHFHQFRFLGWYSKILQVASHSGSVLVWASETILRRQRRNAVVAWENGERLGCWIHIQRLHPGGSSGNHHRRGRFFLGPGMMEMGCVRSDPTEHRPWKSAVTGGVGKLWYSGRSRWWILALLVIGRCHLMGIFSGIKSETSQVTKHGDLTQMLPIWNADQAKLWQYNAIYLDSSPTGPH